MRRACWLLGLALAMTVGCTPAWAADMHTWCVTPCNTAGVTAGVRFYSAVGMGLIWQLEADVDVDEPNGNYCWLVNMDTLYPGENIVFILATAYNSAGESVTEHGQYYGSGYDPAPACP